MMNKVRWRRPPFLLRAVRKMRNSLDLRKRSGHGKGHPTGQAFVFAHAHEAGSMPHAPGTPHRVTPVAPGSPTAPNLHTAQASAMSQMSSPLAAHVATGSNSAADLLPPESVPAETGGGDAAGQVQNLQNQQNPEQPAPPSPPSPPSSPSLWRKIWRWFKLVFWVCFLFVLACAAWLAWQETRDSQWQSQYFHEHAKQATFKMGEGPSDAIRYPGSSPFDDRLGYADLPEFLARLKLRDFEIISQARISPKMAEIADLGLFMPYREKTQVGLDVADCHQQPIFSARYPERIFPSFDAVPPLLVKSLLFIENRELLDTQYPNRNPAVEWDRLAKAVLDQAANGFSGEHKTAGGSTLATQIEKYRHSAEGRTANMKDKLRQMISASLRAYQPGVDTTQTRRQIVLDYLNTVPLSAKPGFGEVNGIGDGLWIWFGRDFALSTQLLGRPAEDGEPQAAQIYKEALALMIAQRRPSYYLGDADSDLEDLTNTHLRVLAASGVISPRLRDAALNSKLATALKTKPAVSNGQSWVSRKAVTAMRTHLSSLLGDSRLYNVDRLDLSVASTINSPVQQSISSLLRELRDAEKAKNEGLQGKGMLGNGDPAQVVYSFTLLEKGENANYLRVQTDNFDQPLDINDGAKLDLGSTAKLRTMITYLDIVGNLYDKLHAMDAEQLKAVVIDPKDKISLWAVQYLLDKDSKDEEPDLPEMLEAALDRKYSASPGEGFFTGGGMHYFGNFRKEDNGRVMTVREAIRNSVNLVFVRLMRDVVHYYMFQAPGSSASLLQDADDPRRAAYLSRFADREGKEFINRFYPKYKGKNAQEAEKILLQNLRPTPSRLAALYQTINPGASFKEFAAFAKDNLPDQNEVSNDKLARLFEQYSPKNMSLADRGYVARVHPLELWVVGFMRNKPQAGLSEVIAASAQERQQVYSWLFNTHRKHAQDKRIAGLLEVEGFLEVHRQWKRMGYPFDSMVSSYASALGASADRPAALAEMMGIIINDGVRKPTHRITSLHFASGTPYETVLHRAAGKKEQALKPEVARAISGAIKEVVNNGTAKRVSQAFKRADGSVLQVAGKTGTGDQRFDVYGAGGRLIESRFVNRSATFVFNIDERYFGSITAYVNGPQSENYDFTSALPVQLLKTVAPSLMPILEAGTAVKANGLPGMCAA